jgi:hypothetical protein
VRNFWNQCVRPLRTNRNQPPGTAAEHDALAAE